MDVAEEAEDIVVTNNISRGDQMTGQQYQTLLVLFLFLVILLKHILQEIMEGKCPDNMYSNPQSYPTIFSFY
jgi:hypothetical protein